MKQWEKGYAALCNDAKLVVVAFFSTLVMFAFCGDNNRLYQAAILGERNSALPSTFGYT